MPNGDGATKVCKKMFLDTLNISYQWVRTADKKKKLTNSTRVIICDKRGKHSNRPFTVPETLKHVARAHISSFPAIDSHYCRENTRRKYLEEGLSISKMYSLFKEKMKIIGETTFVTQQMYRKIFNTEYNYG